MKFKDLLEKYSRNDIWATILYLYPDQKRNVKGYKLALEELLILKPTKTKMSIVIKKGFDKDEQKHYWDVSANDENNHTWAFDFIDWKECLSMEIDSKILSKYSPLDIIAHCLWEMTWHGFTRKEVNKKGNKLARAARMAQKDLKKASH